MKHTFVALAVSMTIALVGCTRQAGDASLREAIEIAIASAGNGAADLTRIGSKDWTRICILKPYTNNEEAERVLGFKWDSEKGTSIAANDGIAVVVLATSNTVVSFTEYGRGKGDFTAIQPRCVPRSQAIVVNRPASVGWPQLAWRT